MKKSVVGHMAHQLGLGLAAMAVALGLPIAAGLAAAAAGFNGPVIGFGTIFLMVPAVLAAAYWFHPQHHG